MIKIPQLNVNADADEVVGKINDLVALVNTMLEIQAMLQDRVAELEKKYHAIRTVIHDSQRNPVSGSGSHSQSAKGSL